MTPTALAGLVPLAPPKKTKWNFEPDTHHVFPEDLEGLPEPIAKANLQARHALARYRGAITSAQEAREAIDAAETFDAHAREAALAVDKPAPEPTAPGRRADAVEAEKQVEATLKIARREIVALYRVVAENYPAYLQGRADVLARTEAEPLKLAKKVRDAWPRVIRERVLFKTAAEFHEQPAAMPLFETRRDPRYEKAEEEIRNALRLRPSSATVPLDLTHIIAALGVLLEREAQEA